MTRLKFQSWKRFLVLLLVLAAAGCARERRAVMVPEGEGRIVVEMSGFRNDIGNAVVSLFPGAKGFPEQTGGEILTRETTIASGRARLVFEPVPWGEYAIAVLHDENRNGIMESSLLGVPKEGHGASNNPQSRFGPPDADESRFLFVAPERVIPVTVHYFKKKGGPPKGR